LIPIKDNIPTDGFPFVTVTLIVVNFVAYLLAIRHGGSVISGPGTHEIVRLGAIPYALTHSGAHCAEVARQTASGVVGPRVVCDSHLLAVNGIAPENQLPAWQTVFTSIFVHASILHIAANMLFLWIFGNTVEDSMGPVKFVVFYLAGGLAALALQVAVGPDSTAPTVGASGAIAAVLGGYAVLYPRARVLTLVVIILLFTVIELPAVVMLGIWFAQQALFGAVSLTNPNGGGGTVAYFAHIGGFLLGLVAIRLLASQRRQTPARHVMS